MRRVSANFEDIVAPDQVRWGAGAGAALAGYVIDETFGQPRALFWAWSYVLTLPAAARDPVIEPDAGPKLIPEQCRGGGTGTAGRMGRLQRIEAQRLVPVSIKTLRPIASGEQYRITSPAAQGLARPELADALESVFDTFAQSHGFAAARPLEIHLARGFAAGSPGHGEGRAIDIDAVAGKSLVQWKEAWDQAMGAAERLPELRSKEEAVAAEKKRNLGYAIYAALLARGGWRVDRHGWRPYCGVMQLFGPWTASEGPWKRMQIADPIGYQQQRLADQQWVFRSHRDHIHVAR